MSREISLGIVPQGSLHSPDSTMPVRRFFFSRMAFAGAYAKLTQGRLALTPHSQIHTLVRRNLENAQGEIVLFLMLLC